MKVKIRSWNNIASWNWDLQTDDNCSICMTAFESPCPSCKNPGDDCPPVEGSCSHYFHLHCIYKWLETNQKCPLDRKPWAEKINSVININNQQNISNNLAMNNGNISIVNGSLNENFSNILSSGNQTSSNRMDIEN